MQSTRVLEIKRPFYERQQAHRWTILAGLCLVSALILVFGVTVWGIYYDVHQVQSTLLESEVGRIRSHAVRTVAIIQDELGRSKMASVLDALKNNEFLRKHWERSVLSDESRLYSTVVSTDGTIVAHSDPKLEGGQLESTWYDRVMTDVGDDVVETKVPALTRGRRAIDVRVPIYFGERIVADYHTALSYDWLETEVSSLAAEAWWKWSWLLGLIIVVETGAGVSLFFISRRIAVLNESVKLSRARRFAEMGQLMAGIVHEIRNPLNAMRLNLHVLNRSRERPQRAEPETPAGDGAVWDFDDSQLIHETNGEIERVEGLLRVLLGYARPDVPRNEDLNVRVEIEATLSFLKLLMERAEILIKARFPENSVHVHMDRDRFRQILLNLLGNAREAMEPGGTIEVCVSTAGGMVEISVADDGPGISASLRDRVFEPFFSTKETGTGLGLAIVRRYSEEAGGDVVLQANQPHGSVFILRLPQTITDLTDSGQIPVLTT